MPAFAAEAARKRAYRKRKATEASGCSPEAEAEPLAPKQAVYCLLHQRVCRNYFSAVTTVGKNMLGTIHEALAQGKSVLIPVPKRAFHRPRILAPCALTFIRNYASFHGYPCPTGRGARCNQPVIWLSPHDTKRVVYNEYKQQTPEDFRVSLAYFYELWREELPFIKVRSKKTDVCETCFALRAARDMVMYHYHRHLVTVQNTFFHNQVARSREDHAAGRNAVHLSFDFAQKVLLPVFTDQPTQ